MAPLPQFKLLNPEGQMIGVYEIRADAEEAARRDVQRVLAKYRVLDVTDYGKDE